MKKIMKKTVKMRFISYLTVLAIVFQSMPLSVIATEIHSTNEETNEPVQTKTFETGTEESSAAFNEGLTSSSSSLEEKNDLSDSSGEQEQTKTEPLTEESSNAPPVKEEESSEKTAGKAAMRDAAPPEYDLNDQHSSSIYNSTFAIQNVYYHPAFDAKGGSSKDGNQVEARTLINAGKFSFSPESTAFGALHEIKRVAFTPTVLGSLKNPAEQNIKIYMFPTINSLDQSNQNPLRVNDLAEIGGQLLMLDGEPVDGVKLTKSGSQYIIDTSEREEADLDLHVSFVIVKDNELNGPITDETYAKCMNDLTIDAIANTAGEEWDGQLGRFLLTTKDELKSMKSDSNHMMAAGLEEVVGETIFTGIKVNGSENGQIKPGESNQSISFDWKLDGLQPKDGETLVQLEPVTDGSFYTFKLNSEGVSYHYVETPKAIIGQVNGVSTTIGYYTLSRDGYFTMVFTEALLETNEQSGTATIYLDGLENYGEEDTIIKIPINDSASAYVDIPGVRSSMELSKEGSLPTTEVDKDNKIIFKDITWTVTAKTGMGNNLDEIVLSDTLPDSNNSTHQLTQAQVDELKFFDGDEKELDKTKYEVSIEAVHWNDAKPDDTNLKGWTATITGKGDNKVSGTFVAKFQTTATSGAGQAINKGNIEYVNNSTLSDQTENSNLEKKTAKATVTVKKTEWFNKTAVDNDNDTEISKDYTITMNQQGLTIPASSKPVYIIDTPQAGWVDSKGKFIDSAMLSPDKISLTNIKVTGLAAGDYTVEYKNGKLTIEINKDITAPITITYTATVNKKDIPDRPVNGAAFRIANSAELAGQYTSGTSKNYPNIVKGTGTIDYNAKTVPFTIKVGGKLHTIPANSYVIDVLPQGFVSASFAPYQGDLTTEKYETALLDALKKDITVSGLEAGQWEIKLIDSGNKSDQSRGLADPQRFMIEFKVDISKDIVINVNTQYFFSSAIFGTVEDKPLLDETNVVTKKSGDDFTNTVHLYGPGEGDDWGESKSHGNIPNEIWNAEKKSATSDFQNKAITWIVDFNTKGEKISNLTIKDPLLAGYKDKNHTQQVESSKQTVDQENLWNNVQFMALKYNDKGIIEIDKSKGTAGNITEEFKRNGTLSWDNGAVVYQLNDADSLNLNYPARMLIKTDLTGDVQPFYKNVAQLDYKYGNNGKTEKDVSASVSFTWAETPNRKAGIGYAASATDQAHVDYSVVLNGNRLVYEDTIIKDSLDTTGGVQNTQLVADSLKIYYAKEQQENKLWVADPARQLQNNVDYFLNYDPDPSNLDGFTISFKAGLKITEPLILNYRANVIGYGDTTKVKNTIAIEGNKTETIPGKSDTGVKDGGSWISGSAKNYDFTIKKVIGENEPTEGAIFKIIPDSKTGLALRHGRTSDDGEALIKNIPRGNYWLYEAKSPAGTISKLSTRDTAVAIRVNDGGRVTLRDPADARSKGVTLENDGNTYYLKVVNQEGETVNLSGKKKWDGGAENVAYQGITIQLYRKLASAFSATLFDETYVTAANDWEYSFENLPKKDADGSEYTYEVREKAEDVPEWQGVTEPITTKTDAEGNEEIIANITNYRRTGTVQLEKRGETYNSELGFMNSDKVLAKVQFLLEKIEGNKTTEISKYMTNVNGKLTISQLTPGNYRLTELAGASTEHYIVDGIQHFTVFENGLVGIGEDPDEPGNNMIPTISILNRMKTQISLKKKWTGTEGIKLPKEITVTIKGEADGNNDPNDVITKTIKLTEPSWSGEVKDLPFSDAWGNKYQYTVSETFTGQESYQDPIISNDLIVDDVGYPSYEIGLENILRTVDLNGVKTWDDQENKYDTRHPIKVQLLQNNKAYGEPINVTEANADPADPAKWNYQFNDLPEKDESGKDYLYTVKEVAFSKNYQSEVVKEENQDSMNLTNRLVVIDLQVSKTWQDGTNKYGLRPNTLEVTLVSRTSEDNQYQPVVVNGQPVQAQLTQDQTDSNKYVYTFTDLPKYTAKGETIQYAIREAEITGYQGENNQVNLINELKTTDIGGRKHWNDNNNFYGLRPEFLDLELLVKDSEGNFQPVKSVFTDATNQVVTSQRITGSATASEWPYQFTDLPAELPSGERAIYGVKEILNYAEGQEVYVTDQTHIAENEGTLTNSLNKVSIDVQKTWQDQSNKFLTRPSSIRFQLYAYAEGNDPANAQKFKTDLPNDNGEGQFIINQPVGNPDIWKLTINGLPERNKNGLKLNYYVRETVNAGDVAYPDYTVEDGSLEIINILKIVDITVNKNWQEFGFGKQTRKDIKLQLLQNGKPIVTSDQEDYIIDLTVADDNWSYTFENLPQKDKKGENYKYSVKELSSQLDYTIEAEGQTVTNKYKLTEVSGKKIWKDDQNKNGLRPIEITVQLYQNDAPYKDQTDSEVMATTSEEQNWTYSFNELPEVDPSGKPYEYTVKEIVDESAKNYTVKEEGMDVINTLITTKVSGTKTWKDNQNETGARPNTITVYLFQDGEKIADKTVSQGSNWQYTFKDLPKYDAKGKLYEYTITEGAVAGYVSKVDGFDLTNTLKDSGGSSGGSGTRSGRLPSTAGGTTSTGTSASTRRLPSTGSLVVDTLLYLGALIVSLVAVVYIYRRKTA